MIAMLTIYGRRIGLNILSYDKCYIISIESD